MNDRHFLSIGASLILTVICCAYCYGQATFFESLPVNEQEPLVMDLTVDYKKLVKEKNDPTYHKATLELTLPQHAEPIEMEVKLRARGNMRRSICYFPPLKLNLKKGTLKALGVQC